MHTKILSNGGKFNGVSLAIRCMAAHYHEFVVREDCN